MKLWSYWLPDVLPHVPGCPVPIAEHEIKRAAQAFFRESRSWRIQSDPFAVAADQEVVAIAPVDPELELLEIDDSSVYFDGQQVFPVTPQELARSFPDDWREDRGTPRQFYLLQPEQMRLYPIPVANAASGIECRMYVVPNDDSTGLPDDVARKFRDAIYLGARARLMLYVNVAWSNPNMAGVYGGAFASAVANAKDEAARAYARARITARSRSKWC